MNRIYMKMLIMVLYLSASAPFITHAADDMGSFVPKNYCGTGWKIDGKTISYDRDTLSDRINGEAELYMPYGFDRMVAARYSSEKTPADGIDIEIYRMASLLDSFGMYANYRQKDGLRINIGAESNLSGSQLFLYQGRYFIHIQTTGANSSNSDALSECAKLVAASLPGERNRPAELSVFDRPEIIKGTERFLPQSLLGYDFLNRGMMAEAVIGGANFQVFRLIGTDAKSVSASFDRFKSQLTQVKIGPEGKDTAVLEGVDPLYGPVILLKKADCLAGALRFLDKKGVRNTLESVCR
jgi:hypothetical protein